MTIIDTMNANETDGLFDPDLATNASEAEWDEYLASRETEGSK
jgi:hypothetical protein